jgi:Anthrone oxygenase
MQWFSAPDFTAGIHGRGLDIVRASPFMFPGRPIPLVGTSVTYPLPPFARTVPHRYNWPMIILEALATLAPGLFCGASAYINLVEHPARMHCGTAAALAQWAPSYKRATVMQAPPAGVGFLSAAGAWLTGASLTWLIAGILLGLVIPFTLIVILPTNRRLLDPALDRNSTDARLLLDRWNHLHGVRTLLSLASFVLCLVSLTGAIR